MFKWFSDARLQGLLQFGRAFTGDLVQPLQQTAFRPRHRQDDQPASVRKPSPDPGEGALLEDVVGGERADDRIEGLIWKWQRLSVSTRESGVSPELATGQPAHLGRLIQPEWGETAVQQEAL